MKRIYTLLVFTVLFIAFQNTATAYQPLFKTTTWFVSYMALGGYGSNIYILDKDTVISKEKCHIVCSYPGKYRIGVFKEDTTSKKVFYLEGTNWKVLYDFSLNLYDRITVKVDGSPYTMHVAGIDTAEYFGIKRKIMKLRGTTFLYPYETYWIEGIGSMQGLVYDDYTNYCVDYYLNCAYQGLERVYCYPNFVQKECPELPVMLTVMNTCITDSVSFDLDLIRNPFIVSWDFGDTINKETVGNQLRVFHKYSSADSFKFTIRFYDTTVKNTIHLSNRIYIDQPEYDFLSVADTSACALDTLVLKTPTHNPQARYYWFGPVINRYNFIQPITKSGTYVLQQQVGACSPTYDTVRVSLIPKKWVSLGNDKDVCAGKTIELSVNSGYDAVNWSTGDTLQKITVNDDATIWAKAVYKDCELSDTVLINYHPFPEFSKIRDTSFCMGSSLFLMADTSQGNKIQWSDFTVNPVKEFTKAGSYWIIVSNNYCSVNNTFKVDEIAMPTLDIGRDTVYCMPSPILLQAKTNYPVQWSTGSNHNAIQVFPPVVVYATATNRQCTATDTITLTIKETQKINAGIAEWCFWEEPYILDLANLGIGNYHFISNNEQQDSLFDAGIFTKELVDINGCKAQLTQQVVTSCDENLFVPDAFTPNGDGLNDVFRLHHPMLQTIRIKLYIYNRYGELVYSSQKPDFAWDGTYKGANVQEGVYLVHLEVQLKSGKRSVYKGNLTLLR